MSRLRPFQSDLEAGIFKAWQPAQGAQPTPRNVLAVLPTGGGKTVVMGSVIRKSNVATAVQAHRGELVSQISTALARERVPHRIIGPAALVRNCQAVQVAELGQHWIDPGARCGVAGVDTLVKRDTSHDSWFREVRLWVTDEAHHVQKENKWGRGVEMFPNAYGLGLTATPVRADGRGLGIDSNGLFHEMIEGPDGRDLIEAGYLTDYRIFAPPSDVVYDGVELGSNGDLNQVQLRAAVHKSGQFVGDIVKHYLRIAPGKLGVTFAVDVESAQEIARAFKASGVAAEVVSAKTDPLNRIRLLREFRARRITMLVNVDLFGEGFDLPAIEVVIMGRKTESLALYMQQFGRALRLMISDDLAAVWDSLTDEQRRGYIAASSKPHAIIIDHVGNVGRHGLPDASRTWSLLPRARRMSGASDAIPTRTCPNPIHPATGLPCLFVYERFYKACPHCGHIPEVVDRSAPQFVDGDLFELSPETLAALRGARERIERAPGMSAPPYIREAWQERIKAQYQLREVMALWAGWQTKQGRSDSEGMRRFFYQFGVDMLTAQSLGRPEAESLTARIADVLARDNVQKAI
jgi:superfamily II DNA or RNA helicase